MNIFGIGPLELLVILAVALIFLGPDKLPELARALGKAVSQFQRMVEPYREEIARAMEPVDEIQRDVKQTLRTVSAPPVAATTNRTTAVAAPDAHDDTATSAADASLAPAALAQTGRPDWTPDDASDSAQNTIAPPALASTVKAYQDDSG